MVKNLNLRPENITFQRGKHRTTYDLVIPKDTCTTIFVAVWFAIVRYKSSLSVKEVDKDKADKEKEW